jgi:hypothetical protein
MPAGVRVRFNSDATVVAGQVEPQPEMSRLDL